LTVEPELGQLRD